MAQQGAQRADGSDHERLFIWPHKAHIPQPKDVLAAVRPPHLEMATNRKGEIEWVSEWTELATGWTRQQLRGCHCSIKFRDPGEDPRLVNNEMFRAFWEEAPTQPGKLYTFENTYVRHADGHHMEAPTVVFYWDEIRQQYIIDVELTEAELARIRTLFPGQFANVFERANMANWHAANYARMRIAHEPQFQPPPVVPAPAPTRKTHAPRKGKWDVPDEMVACLALVASNCSDVWDPHVFTVEYVCARLSEIDGMPRITENTLQDRFELWGWLRCGSLKETLVHMAVEMTADARLY